MKTITTLSIILMAGWASAQSLGPFPQEKHANSKIAQFINTDLQITPSQAKAGSALWTEDFENGLNGWTSDVSMGAVEWMTTTTGNVGGFTPGPLESTTGSPGGTWIVADSDLQGTAGVAEVTTITSPAITGLDAFPALILNFEQSFRQLNDDQTTVEVSSDGGITWTTYAVNEDVAGNQYSPGAPVAELVSINITSALNGGASDIRIRFRWESFEGFTYSWQVDDINLTEAPTDDLVIVKTHYTEWDFDSSPDFSDLPYSIYPVDQVRELKFKAIVTNNGVNEQTGVTLNIEVDGPGANDFSDSGAPITVASGAIDSVNVTGYTPPAVIGDYMVNYEVVQDQVDLDPLSNMASREFSVSQHTFARDLGMMDGSYDNQDEAYDLGNWFGVTADGNTLYAVDVALATGTANGALVIGVVYDSNRDYLTESDEYAVQSSDLNTIGEGNFISLPLFDQVPLVAGEDYFIAVRHFGGADNIEVATSGVSIAQTSSIFDTPGNEWLYVTSTPMVRMNLDPTVGIEETDQNVFDSMNLYPNPVQQNAIVGFELQKASNVVLSVVDALGRTVSITDLGNLPAGQNQASLSRTGLSSGIYSVVLSSAYHTAVNRMIID